MKFMCLFACCRGYINNTNPPPNTNPSCMIDCCKITQNGRKKGKKDIKEANQISK